jgi:1-acyl-sn-glycerol-3-phosphate acyltransferase
MYLYGDDLLPPRNPATGETQNAIIIANHQLYADWVYLWMLLMDRGWHGYLKIMLKNELRHVPMLGWGMDLYEFIFLQRSWAKDKLTIKDHFRRIRTDKNPMCLLLFPEGTVICDETMDRCRQYAAKHSLSFDSRHVLMPRSTGMEFCVRHLMPGLKTAEMDNSVNSVKFIYDLTVGFGGMTGKETPMDQYSIANIFYRGHAPPSIHIRIKRIPIEEMRPLICTGKLPSSSSSNATPAKAIISSPLQPLNSKTPIQQQSILADYAGRLPTLNHQSPEFDAWLLNTYKQKDEEMARFYSSGKLDGEPRRVVELGSKSWAIELLSREFALLRLYIVLAVLGLIMRSLYQKYYL